MVMHLFKDSKLTALLFFSYKLLSSILNHYNTVIQGLKLVMLASRRTVPYWNKKVRFFLGGVILIIPAMITLFASIVYNRAIAETDTDLIANAVIILFITDLDEMAHSILVSICPRLDAGEYPLKEVQEKLTQVQQDLAQSKQEHLETKRNFASQLAGMNKNVEEKIQQIQSQMLTGLNLNKESK